MRLLFIDINAEHPNVMWKNYRNALNYEFEVVCYGPGYVSERELKQGLQVFINRNGEFDVIIVSSILFDSNVEGEQVNIWRTYRYHRYYLANYDLCEAVRFCGNIVNELNQISNIPKIILFQQDIVDVPVETEKVLVELLENGFFLLGLGLQFTAPKIEEGDLGYFQMNMRYRKICQKYYERILSIPPTAINESNICMTQLNRRKYDWIVPGNLVGYPHRYEMYNYLKQKKYNMWDGDRLRSEFIYRKSKLANFKRIKYKNLYDRIVDSLTDCSNYIVPSYIPREEICIYREKYLEGLYSSKYAYVDGSAAKCLVAKYMEIPAAGALMVGETCYGLRELGFLDGVHMIETSVKNIDDIVSDIMNAPEKMQRIASNARQLVIEKHSFRKRAKDIRISCEKILEGKFRGSHWENGNYIIEETKRKE